MKFAAFLVFFLALNSSALAETSLECGANGAELRGIVSKETFFGPPGYGEDPATDRRETQAILTLDAPVTVTPVFGPDADKTLCDGIFKHVKRVTLTSVSDHRFKDGERIIAMGKLFQAFTAHHHTNILMSVTAIKPLEE